RALFLAAPPLFPAAVESALKVQELSGGRIVCQAETPLGLRHGPMAVIGDSSWVILFFSGDGYRRAYELDILAALRAKRLGARRILIGERAALNAAGVGEGELALPLDPDGALAGVPDHRRVPVAVIAGQLIGLFAALTLGLTPDDPGGGVIHRVVQGVRIHPLEGGGGR
ncbi:MAG TPA: sugar isomerase, partial [Limnochordia bacterium]